VSGFRITGAKGFHITFENGFTVSVQFGRGNYADNYNLSEEQLAELGDVHSSTAEVAAWSSSAGDRDWLNLGDHEVLAQQSPAEVLAILNKIAALPAGDRPNLMTLAEAG